MRIDGYVAKYEEYKNNFVAKFDKTKSISDNAAIINALTYVTETETALETQRAADDAQRKKDEETHVCTYEADGAVLKAYCTT